MIISIKDCCVKDISVLFSGSLHLSKSRTIDKLKERFVNICIEINGIEYNGQGNIFDSIQWAHPNHIYPEADRNLDELFFLEGTAYLEKKILDEKHTNIFELDFSLVKIANNFTKLFCHHHNYKVSSIMPMMLAAPFSIALFSAFEHSSILNDGQDFFVQLIETDHFKDFLLGQTGLKPKKAKPLKLHTIPWLMTANLSVDAIQLHESLKKWKPKFIKIKLDSDEKIIKNTLSKMSSLYDEYGLQFYIDCNQSFPSIEKLKNSFWELLTKDHRHLSKNILGIEEPCFSPISESSDTIKHFPVPLYLDENNVSIDDAKIIVSKGYNLVLKHTKPISVLLAQHQIASHYQADCAVQDLTFSHNAYFSNFALYRFINSNIPFEANYIQFVDQNWGDSLPIEYRSKICVSNGGITTTGDDAINTFPNITKGSKL